MSADTLKKLPVYTDTRLNIDYTYTTIDINNQYYEVGEDVDLVNDNAIETGVAKIVAVKLTSFDYLSSNDLRNFSNPHLALWPNAVEYFQKRFKELFSFTAEVQLITFQVTGTIKFDEPAKDTSQMEKELGITNDIPLDTEEGNEQTS